jgi:hypothetical protein
MMPLRSLIILATATLVMILFSQRTFSQTWTFIKEKDGIFIYTKKEAGKNLKSFKGVTDIKAPVEAVFNLIGNAKNVDWWDKNVKDLRILKYEKDKVSQYYLVYDAPWPVSDRDLCAEAIITTDPVTRIRTVVSKPMHGVVAEKPGCVRITNYWQKWLIEPTNRGVVHITLEGYVDPAGVVPDWVYNMVITDTPLKIMRGMKEKLEKHQ